MRGCGMDTRCWTSLSYDVMSCLSSYAPCHPSCHAQAHTNRDIHRSSGRAAATHAFICRATAAATAPPCHTSSSLYGVCHGSRLFAQSTHEAHTHHQSASRRCCVCHFATTAPLQLLLMRSHCTSCRHSMSHVSFLRRMSCPVVSYRIVSYRIRIVRVSYHVVSYVMSCRVVCCVLRACDVCMCAHVSIHLHASRSPLSAPKNTVTSSIVNELWHVHMVDHDVQDVCDNGEHMCGMEMAYSIGWHVTTWMDVPHVHLRVCAGCRCMHAHVSSCVMSHVFQYRARLLD